MMIFAKGWSERKDGPGHRRIYYLKGCNLHCRWCGAPESISKIPQLMFYPERKADFSPDCLCDHGAIENGNLNRRICEACLEKSCRKFKHPAVNWVGEEVSNGELLHEILHFKQKWPDMAGVTFGGGEPTLQAAELIELLEKLKEHGVHTAIESNATTDTYLEVTEKVDYVISDLKAAHEDVFRNGTGGTLDKVIDNLKKAAENFRELLIRIPVITEYNDSRGELEAIGDILEELSRCRRQSLGASLQVELLQLHHFGEPKYEALGLNYEFAGVSSPSAATVAEFEKRLMNIGISIVRN